LRDYENYKLFDLRAQNLLELTLRLREVPKEKFGKILKEFSVFTFCEADYLCEAHLKTISPNGGWAGTETISTD
jgi:hypothetical protein